mgnify:CR=1 FL=1
MLIAHSMSVRLLQWLVASGLFGLLLFGLAGRVDLVVYWAYFAVCIGKGLWIALRMDSGLADERFPDKAVRANQRNKPALFF